MADKKIQPKAPEKAEPAAGARESSDRETLRDTRRIAQRKGKRVKK